MPSTIYPYFIMLVLLLMCMCVNFSVAKKKVMSEELIYNVNGKKSKRNNLLGKNKRIGLQKSD